MTEEITIAGKAPPEPDELELAQGRGFEDIELYIERDHLKNVEETIETLEEFSLNIVSVHTPHVPIEDPKWLHRTDRLAKALDAYLVVHSNRIIHTFVPDIEELNFEAEYGYENNPGVSERHLKNMILKQEHEFVLDTAHLFMAEGEYLSITERLLEEFRDQIQVIHLCDSSLTKDGLGFGEGAMDMEAISKIIGRNFEGTVVLEVMPDVQQDALDRLQTYWEDLD